MEKFNLHILNEDDLSFEGNKIAEVKFSNNAPYQDFKDIQNGNWELYETKSERFVCYKSETDGNNNTKIDYQICQNHDEVKQYFGYCENAKSLYKQAGINCSIDVDILDIEEFNQQYS